MSETLIRNADFVITMDDARRELKAADLRLEGGVITEIGQGLHSDGEVVDASGCILTPGLVNTHHHLYQSMTRAVPAGQDALLFGWLKTLYPIWAQMTPEHFHVSAQVGLADTRGAAWALAHHGEGVAPPGEMLPALQSLPVAALRLGEQTTTALARLGLRQIGDLAIAPRAPLTRRFGPDVMMRLDQALGRHPEEITPLADPPHYGVRMTLPEPIGLVSDVMAGAQRLLTRLCATLTAQEMGARVFEITLRRVDRDIQNVELRLARPLRDPQRILPLFERGLAGVDAGFGIDQLRLEATQVEPLPARQITHVSTRDKGQLDDLITRIGTRIGLENIQRFLPADSHIPERSFIVAPAAYSDPAIGWASANPRPLCLIPPEPIAGTGPQPPERFRWRRMSLTTGRATGPERIAPEWWLEDDNWRSGLRDYWRIETLEGRRLWLFYTPQNPGWFVQGEFA